MASTCAVLSASSSASGESGMVSSDEILGERERKEVGVEGNEGDDKEKLEGKGSLNWIEDRDGEDELGRRVEVDVLVRAAGCGGG